jgi:hypothetical protein
MTKAGKILLGSYGFVAFFLLALGFAGLFGRRFGFTVPIVSDTLVPALHRHAVWGETLRGRAILIGGEDWFFLIVLGIVIFLGIVVILLNTRIASVGKTGRK